MELGNHAEFLGIMSRVEMLSMFFTHDGGETQKWRLKGHAESEYWRWLCSWAVMLRSPADLGYDAAGFVLPPLEIHAHPVDTEMAVDGMLFAVEAQTLTERRGARKASMTDRVQVAADLATASDESWLIWCDLNAEGDALETLIPGAVQVAGRHDDAFKERAMADFADGRIRVLISKASICGHGMNWQHCPNVAFVGLSDSYEAYYQAVRRCWRFGQTRPVNCHIVTSTLEGAVVANIQRKEEDARHMATEMVDHMKTINAANIRGATRDESAYVRDVAHGRDWTAHLGDCVEVTREIASESIDYSIFSPPFASLYTYSNSDRDMGNARTHSEFYAHFSFLVDELYRVLKSGRLVSFHCMNIPTSKERDGYIGISDFRGELIRMFQQAGFIYHSEVVIWKDPMTAMQRTKALGLLYKQLKKDSVMSRQGIPDYLVTMRKPGVNPDPVTKDPATFPVNLWQRYASPVWFDVNPSNTLQRESAREEKDERHIAPLQIEVVERAIQLWTNPGDTVFTPFLGIGTEAYVAVKMGRRGIGAELKPSYFKQAVANLQAAEHQKDQPTIFDLLAGSETEV
jgi:DNA modification methylase